VYNYTVIQLQFTLKNSNKTWCVMNDDVGGDDDDDDNDNDNDNGTPCK